VADFYLAKGIKKYTEMGNILRYYQKLLEAGIEVQVNHIAVKFENLTGAENNNHTFEGIESGKKYHRSKLK